MANPFPSDWSLTSPKEETAPPARPPLTLALRNFSLKNVLSYCSQIMSRFSFDSSSPPALESSSSTRESTTPSSPITPVTPGGEYASAFPALPSSPRAKRQRLTTEMRGLSDSQLGLQLAIILPESVCDSPSAVSASCPPQYCQRIRLRQSEGPGDAIPHLDLCAVPEEEEDARIGGGGGGQGAEAPPAASEEEVSSADVDAVRLNGAGTTVMISSRRSRRSSSELAKHAERAVAPRDLLFK